MLLPFEAFSPHKRGRDGLQAACKSCEVERLQVRKHGITSLEKRELADAQDGCAICGRPTPGGKGWVVDHDHACCAGERSCVDCRRGILCQWCNNVLGYALDNPVTLRRAADYIASQTRLAPAIPLCDSLRTNGLERTDVDTSDLCNIPELTARARAYKAMDTNGVEK